MKFLKNYHGTLAIILLLIFDNTLGAPIKPWIPEEDELQQLSGMPIFQDYSTINFGSGTYFKVDGIKLDCGFNGSLGGMGGCSHFSDVVDTRKMVKATYFKMVTNYGLSARMLNTLEQDGQLLISEKMSYKRRLGTFKSNKKSSFYLNLFFCFTAIFLWFCEASQSRAVKQTR